MQSLHSNLPVNLAPYLCELLNPGCPVSCVHVFVEMVEVKPITTLDSVKAGVAKMAHVLINPRKRVQPEGKIWVRKYKEH